MIGIFRVDNAAGDILLNNGTWLRSTIESTDPNKTTKATDYRNAALARKRVVFDEGPGEKLVAPDKKIVTIPDDWDYFSYYIHQNGNSIYQNGNSKVGRNWFAFKDVNEDRVPHFQIASNGSIEVEDLSPDPQLNPWNEARDSDFNDAVFNFTALTNATLDIDTDSDNNGKVNGADDSVEENYLGKRIFINKDDDNKNGVVDSLDTNAAYTGTLKDNDFAEIRLSYYAPPANTNGYRLELVWDSSKLNLYAGEKKEALSATTWNLGGTNPTAPPTVIYAEGIRLCLKTALSLVCGFWE